MKNVIITGIDKGIGRALMEKFLGEGYFVMGTYLSDEPEQRENLQTFQLDLTKPEGIKKCVEEINNTGKKTDILINNAGILLDRDESDLTTENLRGTLEVNLIGASDFTEQIIPAVNSGGHIIFVSSIAGSFVHVDSSTGRAPNHYPAYRISKAALNMYGNTLAERLRDQRIIVSLIHPGWVRTDMGGPKGDISPEEAAENIFKFAISKPETGNFWFNGEKLPW